MQTMNFLVLTKSAKHNELCVAGVDLVTNNFVRLVADGSGKEIKKSDFVVGTMEVQILDIIEVLVSPVPLKIQSENVVLHKINKIVNTLDFAVADKIITNIKKQCKFAKNARLRHISCRNSRLQQIANDSRSRKF